MINSKSLNLDQREADAANSAVLGGDISGNSDFVKMYEDNLATYFGSSRALACSSGTAALYLALSAADVRNGDEVVVSSLGAVMSALPVLELGAKPVFADAEPVSFRLTPATIDQIVTPKPKRSLRFRCGGIRLLGRI